MAEYYLISQLPSLDGLSESAPLPITEERFLALCEQHLKRSAWDEMKRLTLSPPRLCESTGDGLIDAWTENERSLRLALAKVRAEKMKKPFDTQNKHLSASHCKVASAAIEMENPMEAEAYLNRYRLELLEALRPMDGFSEEYIFYYGLKLKLLSRIRCFDTEAGVAAYRNIYNAILRKEGVIS